MPRLLDTVELVTIGTELLLGFTVDSNAALLGQVLSAAGVRVARHTSVADHPDEIRASVDEALARFGFVITTGGLGPTGDDMSKQAVADLLGMPLQFDDDVWQAVLARYTRFSRVPVESNRSQAMVPRGGVALHNRWGTAPGLWLETERGVAVMLPGVPLEMRKLMEHEVLPRLAGRTGGSAICSATLRTVGVPESTLAEQIGHLGEDLAPLTLAYLPGVAGVDLRLTAWNLPVEAAQRALCDGIDRLQRVAVDWAYGVDATDLASVVLGQLRSRTRRLAVAESCTGGLLGGRITDVAGASDVFVGGVVAYHDAIKEHALAVPAALIAKHGAVSAEVAHAMAAGVAAGFSADVAVSVTGIAGPDGGSDEKPVGTVWFGFFVDGQIQTRRSVFGGTRREIRERAVQGALLGLWQRLGR
ncbi:MAG: competence/damage-inducible protein A [Gemmatimonadales bacterium]